MKVKVECFFCKVETIKLKKQVEKYTRSFCSRGCFANYKKSIFKKCATLDCEAKSKIKNLCTKCYDHQRYNAPKRLEARKEYSKKISERRKTDPEFREKMNKIGRKASKKSRNKDIQKSRKRDLLGWDSIPRRYSRAKSMAEKRGLDFTIDLETYERLATKETPCHYGCGNTVSRTGIGLDRMDNSKGYIPENVVSCCGFCNIMKSSLLSYSECVEVIKMLKNTRGSGNIWDGYLYSAQFKRKKKDT